MWFRNRYRHDECDTAWEDEHSCMCNDKCPTCDAEIEPAESDDLTLIIVENDGEDRCFGRWGVYLSPEAAEYDPSYVRMKSFFRKADAAAFVEEMRKLL